MKYFILILLFVSCATTEEGMYNQDLDQVYIGSGIEKYYLPDLPQWSNFSEAGMCKRVDPIRYINFKDMHLSYSMTYEQLIQYQLMLNRKFYQYKKSTGRTTVFLKDESYISFNVHQQILGGGRDFLIPKFKKINLVWIDDILKNDKEIKKLKELMQTERMSQGHPVFLSMCLSSYALEKFINENGFSNMGVKGISQSMFSPYNSEFEMNFGFSLDLKKLFKNKNILLFGKRRTKAIKGYNKFIKY